ncbi:hypothetical protein [Streptomyces sp. NPDC058297]|uniref:hypothetical protein n=1 Tax=Streptomyces sp. NPDC058297 TaxID=3346433 RepID=UPI0036E5F347
MFMEAHFNRSGRPWWRRWTWKPPGHDERSEEYASVAAIFVRLRHAGSVIEMYGGDTVFERTVELVGVADEMRLLARAGALGSGAAGWPCGIPRRCRARRGRSDAARGEGWWYAIKFDGSPDT